jgi:two-component system, OmpR family, sensor histidine kinase KdpD
MIEDEYVRPDPEELLRRISAGETNEKRGRLTIFFGYAPGVGKTYAMLYDAIPRKTEQKLNVVVGYIELHKRTQTEELIRNFETIPPLKITYNDLELKEPNVAEIIKRKPDIVLIDELAHTNASGMKNDKRYKDIEEILDAGINVNTTLNVQHLESLKDIVYQITGVRVAENIPDPIFLYANEVKLIDLPIDDLLKRLKDGKVYTKDMAGKAVQKFFRAGNLLALRQIALKQLALRLDNQMTRYIKAHDLEGSWPAPEKVLVGINASSYSGQLVRAAYRLAEELEAEIIALHIETDEDRSFSEEEGKWLKNALDVAERLGIQTITVQSSDLPSKISSFAQQNGITKIVIGKPYSSGSYRSVDGILAKTEGIDMYIFAGKGNISLKKQTSSVRNPVKEMLNRIRRINKSTTVTKKLKVRNIPNKYLIQHNRKACIGCGLCATICPENWAMDEDGKATPKRTEVEEIGANQDAADACPKGCIKIVPKKESDIF